MRIPRIFVNQDLTSHSTFQLDSSTAHYLGKVLRLSEQRPLIVFNGKGGEYDAQIIALTKNQADISTTEFRSENRMPNLRTELAISISRGDKMDWIVQKATELGVSKIYPLFSERSEVKLTGDRLEKKLRHWQQVAIAACEQCQRNIVPGIESAIDASDYIRSSDAELKLVLHHRTEISLKQIHKTMQESPSSVILLIGPEGGLTDDEIQLAVANNYTPLRLGPRVLRTETAPLAALSILQQYWGDMDA